MRWLSGMVTNTVQGLQENEGNYSFVLNNQGRIQGDCQIYRRANELVLDTARSRVAELLAHLNHYIIMDEVELVDVSDDWTALQLIGPKARHILETAAIPVLAAAGPPDANFHLSTVHIGEAEAVLVQSLSILLPRYELWMRPQDAGAIWRRLLNAGAEAAGVNAIEALRIAEGTPLFGVDFGEKDLPQETGQTRALNFTKGCYLGQEIVERIRSRGKVHRKLHQFALDGEVPRTPFELRSQGQPVGQISSAASISTSQLTGSFGLGFVRDELFDSGAAIEYDGGRATILERPPRMPAS